jgi:hypothetical protein
VEHVLERRLNQGAAGRTEAIGLLNLHNQKYRRLCDGSSTRTEQLRVMRVASDGTSTDMTVKTWEPSFTSTYNSSRIRSSLERTLVCFLSSSLV